MTRLAIVPQERVTPQGAKVPPAPAQDSPAPLDGFDRLLGRRFWRY